jgi:hypothetical protein
MKQPAIAAPGGPLPGMKQPVGGPLPGMKKPVAVAPAFLQPAQPAPQPTGPVQDARDPLGQASAPMGQAVAQPMIFATEETSIEDAPMMSAKSRKTMMYAALFAIVAGLAIGYLLGTGVQHRRELNIAIRDALIIEYELKQAGDLFNELQTMVSTALTKAARREYDPQHLEFMRSRIQGSPLKPQLLTERNYKTFDMAAVNWLMDYYKKWDALDSLIQTHRRKTQADEAAIKDAEKNAAKLMQTNFGIVFMRDEQQNKKLVGNVVVLGAVDGSTVQVQQDTGTYASERTLYNPEGEDCELSKEPDKYVVEVGMQSKGGLLGNATQSHFVAYSMRLKDINDLMKGMTELQQNLLDKISRISSQDPAPFADPDPEEAFEDYKTHIKNIEAAAAAAAE